MEAGARSDKPDSNGMGEAGDGGSGNGSGEATTPSRRTNPRRPRRPDSTFTTSRERQTRLTTRTPRSTPKCASRTFRQTRRRRRGGARHRQPRRVHRVGGCGVGDAREQNPRASNSVAAKSVAKTAAKTAATAAEVGKAEDAGDATKESAMNQTKNVGFKAPAPVAPSRTPPGFPPCRLPGTPARIGRKCRPPRRRIRSVARRWSAG